MGKKDNYFQFPVCCLRLNRPIDQVNLNDDDRQAAFETIVRYCTWDLAQKSIDVDEHQLEGMAQDALDQGLGHEGNNELHEYEDPSLLYAAGMLGVALETTDTAIYHECHKKVVANESGRLLVRLRRDIFIEARESWPWRDFATLSAIYAGIGDQKMSRLTRDRIGTIAMGYSGQRERDRAHAKQLQLTERQTRHDIDRLNKRKLFVRGTANGRNIFFSHRRTEEQLDADLIYMYSKRKQASPKERMRKTRDSIRGQRP